MKLKRRALALVLASFSAAPPFAAEGGAELLGRLNGKAISAKFEMKGNTLMLSVYTAGKGLDKDAEHYSAIPAVRSGVPVYDILVATSDGKSKHLSVDGNTGNSRET